MRKRIAILTIAVLATFGVLGLGAHRAFADQRDFRQYNRSNLVIVHEYISPASMDDWGVDQLGGDVIMPGGSYLFRFTRGVDAGVCIFDIRVDASDGTSTKSWNVNLCTTDSMTFHTPPVF